MKELSLLVLKERGGGEELVMDVIESVVGQSLEAQQNSESKNLISVGLDVQACRTPRAP